MTSADSDYGFQALLTNQVSSSKLADSESNNYRAYSTFSTYSSDTNQESLRYFKIVQKLTQSSLKQPANLPILCTKLFNTLDTNWNFLASQLVLKQSEHKLIALNQGEPVNAMFYSSDLDLIYVRTADDLEGFVPRTYCKLLFQNENHNHHLNEYLQPVMAGSERNCGANDPNESIKYHSLSASEYDDLNEEHVYSNIVSDLNPRASSPPRTLVVDAQTFLKPITNSFHANESDDRRISNLYQNKRVKELAKYDSGYRSEDGENMTNHFSTMNSHGSEDNVNILDSSPMNMNKHLYQSRSRLPINLELADDRELDDEHLYKKATFGFENFTYKTSPSNVNRSTRLSISVTPKCNKNTRRSLDPSLTSSCCSQKSSFENRINFFRHNLERNNSDLDLNKIELDSISETCEVNSKLGISSVSKVIKKNWRIVVKHEAKTQQEVSVEPGMIVFVIREHNSWLYIKLVQEENMGKIQRYGFIPRNCAVDLDELIHKNDFINCSRKHECKPRITAL